MKRACKNIYTLPKEYLGKENDYNASSPPRRTNKNLKL